MDRARIALATLGTIGSGIVLGLAVNPTLRTMPEADWRARYRAGAPAPPPPPQPGVSYFGDGSTAWAWGGAPVRIDDSLTPVGGPGSPDEPEQWTWLPSPPLPPPLPTLAPEQQREDFDAEAAAAERAAAQAAVTAALARSDPRAQQQAEAADPADAVDSDEPTAVAVMEMEN